MISKTKGIALGKIKYGDTSVIARVFTEKFGLQSYIVNGIRSQKGKFKMALFQPLTLLDMVVYHKESSSIQRISEVKCDFHYSTLAGNMKKSAIVIFLTELLEKTLRESSNPEEIFGFLYNSFIHFDDVRTDENNFHLIFLIDFAGYLGFQPQSINDFEAHVSEFKMIEKEERLLLAHLISNKSQKFPYTSNVTRRNCLNLMIEYYRSHIDSLKEIKSTKILREVLD